MDGTLSCCFGVDPMLEEALGYLKRAKSAEDIVHLTGEKGANLIGNADSILVEESVKFEVLPSKLPSEEVPQVRPTLQPISEIRCLDTQKLVVNMDVNGDHKETACVAVKKSAKVQLIELCAANHWAAPFFELCEEEGPGHQKMFSYKVKVEVDSITSTILESFGEPRAQKRAAQEHAAEGALWFLKHLGYGPES